MSWRVHAHCQGLVAGISRWTVAGDQLPKGKGGFDRDETKGLGNRGRIITGNWGRVHEGGRRVGLIRMGSKARGERATLHATKEAHVN